MWSIKYCFMRFKLLLSIFLLIPFLTKAQNETGSRNAIKSHGFSVGLNGLLYNQMISKHLLIELGYGLFGPIAGVNYFITNTQQRRLNYYTGFSLAKNFDDPLMIHVPIGLSYFARNNFQYSADIGVMIGETVDPNPSPWLGLKIGYRFGDDISTLKEREKTNFRNIISGQLGSYDVVIGAVYERLLTPFLGAEAGIGLAGASMGIKIYSPSISSGHLNLHIGATQSIGFFGWKTYIPVGVNYLTSRAFRYSFDVGPQIWYDEEEIRPSFSIRVGKAF